MPPREGYRQTPEHKAKIGAANRRQFDDPAKRQAVSDRFRALWQDPEWVAGRKRRSKQTPEEVQAARSAYYQRNKDAIKARARAYYYADLEASRAASRAYARAHAAEARRRYDAWIAKPENRARVNTMSRAYSKANREIRNMQSARRRARLLGQFVEDVDSRVVLANYGGLCGWCGYPVGPDFHVDHIVALVHGGEHSYANTQPVHPACNYEKRTVFKERAA